MKISLIKLEEPYRGVQDFRPQPRSKKIYIQCGPAGGPTKNVFKLQSVVTASLIMTEK